MVNEGYNNDCQLLILRLDSLGVIRAAKLYSFMTFCHSLSICYFWYPSLDQVPNQMSLCDVMKVNEKLVSMTNNGISFVLPLSCWKDAVFKVQWFPWVELSKQ